MTTLPRFTAARYLQPLREGGSLPAVVDTDGGLFVVKFRGAGQGAKALIAEIIVGLLAERIGVATPQLALVTVPPPFGLSEPDPEIQDLLRGSHGVNVGSRYLDGAFNFSLSAAAHVISPEFAARVVWLDAFVTNPDRTHRNPNILIWNRQPWLIDHGAALYAHHDWSAVDEDRIRSPFTLIRDHVLLTASGDLAAADAECSALLGGDVIDNVLAAVPDELLLDPVGGREFPDAVDARAKYSSYLRGRLHASASFVQEAVTARATRLAEPTRRIPARR